MLCLTKQKAINISVASLQRLGTKTQKTLSWQWQILLVPMVSAHFFPRPAEKRNFWTTPEKLKTCWELVHISQYVSETLCLHSKRKFSNDNRHFSLLSTDLRKLQTPWGAEELLLPFYIGVTSMFIKKHRGETNQLYVGLLYIALSFNVCVYAAFLNPYNFFLTWKACSTIVFWDYININTRIPGGNVII